MQMPLHTPRALNPMSHVHMSIDIGGRGAAAGTIFTCGYHTENLRYCMTYCNAFYLLWLPRYPQCTGGIAIGAIGVRRRGFLTATISYRSLHMLR